MSLGVLLKVFHCRLSDFIHKVDVHRRDEAIRGWRNWLREDHLVRPHRWLRPDLVLLAPFLQCEPHLTRGGSGVVADPGRIDEEFRNAWLPYFCRSGQRETSLEEFTHEVEGYPFCRRFPCLGLLVRCLLRLFIVRVLLLVFGWLGLAGVQSFTSFLV